MSKAVVHEEIPELASYPMKVRPSTGKRLKRYSADKDCGTMDGAVDALLKKAGY